MLWAVVRDLVDLALDGGWRETRGIGRELDQGAGGSPSYGRCPEIEMGSTWHWVRYKPPLILKLNEERKAQRLKTLCTGGH